MIIANQKPLFSIPADVTFLNCANMSPLSNSVHLAGVEAIDKCRSPWEIKSEDWFNPGEELRALFARIISADAENIALIPSVSYGIAIAARNISLRKSQKIIVIEQQYPSNYYAWHERSKESGAEIVVVERPQDNNWTPAILDAIDDRTGVVAIPNCHWTDGSLIDLEKISKAARNVNAGLVVDASQSVGAYPLDVNTIRPDFLVTVGYKWLMGPYGLGYLYADRKYCADGMPLEFSWLNKKGSEDFAGLVAYRDEYRAGARRFDSGEYPSFIKIPMAISALNQILKWGVENIQDSLSAMTEQIIEKAHQSGYETTNRKYRAGHMAGVKFPGDRIVSLSKKLSDSRIYISWRGTSMRISPHLYNDANDMNRLCEFL